MNNATAYGLLVDATKATFKATGRSWDTLSPTEQGERLNATRAGLRVILGYHEEQGHGMRSRDMRALVEASDVPTGEAAISRVRGLLASAAAGNPVIIGADEAGKLVQALDTLELAD
jgi:hypothetical protein